MKILPVLAAVVAAAMLVPPPVALAADAGRAAILSDYAAQARAPDPGFAGFSAARGEVLLRGSRSGGEDFPAAVLLHARLPGVLWGEAGRPLGAGARGGGGTPPRG